MFRVSGVGFSVEGLGFQVQCLVFRVSGVGFSVEGLGFQVQCLVFWVSGVGLRVSSMRGPRSHRETRSQQSIDICHCRANLAHIRQSRPDFGLGFQ